VCVCVYFIDEFIFVIAIVICLLTDSKKEVEKEGKEIEEEEKGEKKMFH
jgi:hypothetical protein